MKIDNFLYEIIRNVLDSFILNMMKQIKLIMIRPFLFFILIVLNTSILSAQQFDLSAELKPRYENRYGFQTLRNKGERAGNFVSQRTRLTFNFSQKKLRFKASLQNVRVWGDVGTLSTDDSAMALHEAWAEAVLSEKFVLRLGRQEIAYDDQRIFGVADWAQQARSHDALLFKYTPNTKNRIDVGVAYNADKQSNLDALYSNAAGYKTFQYVWYHGDFNNFGLSFLLLNTGIEYLEEDGENNESEDKTIDFMQTLGPRITYKSGSFNANAATYLQTGKSLNADVNAYYLAGNIGYDINTVFEIGAGVEYFSGKDMDDTSTDINSFAPLFGTNHKFNGWMDYFYVGNHSGNVGLIDINTVVSYKKNRFSAKVLPHFFLAPGKVIDGSGEEMDSGLGTEIDFAVGYEINKSITLNAGYSRMFATETMEVIKGGNKDVNNSWAWVMFVFKPKLFSNKSDQ